MRKQEDLQSLCEDVERWRGRAIAAGLLHVLKSRSTGPMSLEMLVAILASCLLVVALLGLALLPAFLSLGLGGGRCCSSRSFRIDADNAKPSKVFFVKFADQNWTVEELCLIETAARRYPEFNIITINLLKGNNSKSSNEPETKFFDEFVESFLENKTFTNGNTTSSEHNLFLDIPNVRNIYVSIKTLFAGSPLLKEIENLSIEDIILAAKFEVIWASAGISLDPLSVHQLETVRDFFHTNKTEATASVQLEDDLQAAGVPCQSFVGLVIREIAKSSVTYDRQALLERALAEFCLSPGNCPGVRIVEPISKRPGNFTTCPTIYPVVNAEGSFNGTL